MFYLSSYAILNVLLFFQSGNGKEVRLWKPHYFLFYYLLRQVYSPIISVSG